MFGNREAISSGMSAKQKAIASHWRENKLGDVLPLKYGKARSPQFGYPRPGTQTFGSNGAFGSFDRALTTKPTLIVGRKGAAGAVHYSSAPCWPIDTAFYTEGSEGTFLPFFRYLLESLQLVRLDRSTAIPSLSRDDYDARIVRHPESEAEQRRIVAEIEKQFTRLEAGVAALRRVQANLKRYRAAVLKAACTGQLVPTEAEWPQKQIATAIQTMDQGWSPKCESEPSADDATWAVIKTTAIQNLRFDEVENKKLPASLKPRPHLELQSGDLLVTRAGPRNRVGVACLVKITRPRLMLCDKAYRLRCKPNVAHPAFLEMVLNAPHIVDAVNKLKTGISDSGVNLTQKRFGELIVPLPPLAEQTRIVAEVERRLSVVEELESVVSANLQRATRLRQSILQKAFTGELV